MLIYDASINDLILLLADWGYPSFRANQIWSGLYKNFWNSPEQFSTLPLDLKEKLAEHYKFDTIIPSLVLNSSDGQTRKILFSLSDGKQVEAVLMRYEHRRTLCISTQVGCAMGCTFCATGQMGFTRHLTSGEIVAQVMFYARQLHENKETVTNIVIMGMGEPFHNYSNTMNAVDLLNDPDGYNFGARRITISTSGLVPAIKKFASEKRQINLAVSLHSSDDAARTNMMPVNKSYNISDLIQACKEYTDLTGRRITFEWALINGVNDSPEEAKRLSGLLKGMLCHVNAIPLNPTTGYTGKATTRERAERFKSVLEENGIPCTIRIRRGIDIQAGCGQLASHQIINPV